MRNTRKTTIAALIIVALLVMTLGYSLLSQELNITGVSNISSIWQVEITDMQETIKNGAALTYEKEFNQTTASFVTYLVSPGDKMSYEITIENKGTLDAKLNSLVLTKQDNPAILFNISNLSEGEVLKAGESKTFYVSVEYSNSITEQPKNVRSDCQLVLNYIQDDGKTTSSAITNATTDFNFALADSNILTSYNALSDVEVEATTNEINLYGAWQNYDDQTILKVSLPQIYNDALNDAKYSIEITNSTISSKEEYDLTSLLSSSEFENTQYMYVFLKSRDNDTTQKITFTIAGNTYKYNINFYQPKGA